MLRGRRSIAIDLKHRDGVDTILRLVDGADALIEGFRPGVTDRLGVGPETCMQRNPRLVYGRVTGWGQAGPYAQTPGRDINYIGLSGALSLFGRRGEPPVPPTMTVGDFGGGGMLLAFGIACALLEARSSGQGQVIDAAIVDGSGLLTAMIYGLKASGTWTADRGSNAFDTGAPFYDAYETADGKYVTIGAVDPAAYELLRRLLGLAEEEWDDQLRRDRWPDLKVRMAKVFRSKTRDEWDALLEGSDVCYAPALTTDEAPHHPHNLQRHGFIEVAGVIQPAPAPRFSRTPPGAPEPPPEPGQDTDGILSGAGFTALEIARLRSTGAVA